mgnify:CR=1 FL=1
MTRENIDKVIRVVGGKREDINLFLDINRVFHPRKFQRNFSNLRTIFSGFMIISTRNIFYFNKL